MTNQQTTQVINISTVVPRPFNRRLAIEAARRGLSKSEAMRQALTLWLNTCPICDGATIPHPDPNMPGVRYCPVCNESVSVNSANPRCHPELVEGQESPQ